MTALTDTYTDLDRVRARMAGAGLTLSQDWDDSITDKCGEVTADINRKIGNARGDRTFKFVADSEASARTFRGKGVAYLPIADCIEIISVAIRTIPSDSPTELTSTDWIAINSTGGGLPYVAIERVADVFPSRCLVEVVAKWGFGTDVPADATEAASIEVIRSHFGDQAGNDDRLGFTPFGSVMVAKAFTSKLVDLVAGYGYGGGFLRG